MNMLKRFLKNENGNFAVIFSLAALPIIGAVAVSVDYSNLSRLSFNLSDAVDSTCSVVAREFLDGKDNDVAKLAGKNFFDVNIDSDYASSSEAIFTMPDEPGNTEKTLKCKGRLTYKPLFGPVMAFLNGTNDDYIVVIQDATMKMKNVAEIALVVDNSGSMAQDKYGNYTSDASKQRITLMKAAAKRLVTDMIVLGAKIQQSNNPVKFSVVPFSGAVNVGTANAAASWIDNRGISPIHHEHLNWGTPTSLLPVGAPPNPTGFHRVAADGAKLDAAGNPLTRFSILNALKFKTGGVPVANQCENWRTGMLTAAGANYSRCRVFRRTGTTDVLVNSAAASTATGSSVANLTAKYRWTGCVEARPNGMDVTDDDASGANAFVPFFVPDELNVSQYFTTTVASGENNWWPDYETDTTFRTNGYWAYDAAAQMDSSETNASSTTWQSGTARPREVNVAKYFVNKPYTSSSASSSTYSRTDSQYKWFDDAPGPNDACRTTAITPLTGVESTLHAAIDQMSATSGTNIPEGIAWGWRTVSSKAPFSTGVSETRKDIDKVVIVLTDGANTYSPYDPGDGGDMAGNKSNNHAFGRTGYAGNGGPGGTATASSSSNVARMFTNSTASKTDHGWVNYQLAMDDKMKKICANIKDQDIIVMMIALDMDPSNYEVNQRPAIEQAVANMTTCAGESKTKRNGDGSKKKLFWNATSDNLDATFKEIADELSNLRFTQ